VVEVEGSSADGARVRWTDNHCHLDAGDDAAEQIAAARDAGVTRLVNVGTDPSHSRSAIEVAQAHAGVWATAGVHPHDAKGGLGDVALLLEQPKVVAVGECGLDYHYDHSPRPVQRELFAAQIALAHATGLALVIHTREAWDDTFAVLADGGVPPRTIFHCFTGGAVEARRCLDAGAFLSFSGIVSFPSAGDVREAAASCPLDRLLVETDAPFLAPVPHRGRRNRPAFVPLVGEAVAAAKGVAVEAIAESSWNNASRAYEIDNPQE
jgi:TatD DNase family protein